ncbi:SusC/RagA family TonB-linked outer membrane protein [Mucilaginibacter yixingensis]
MQTALAQKSQVHKNATRASSSMQDTVRGVVRDDNGKPLTGVVIYAGTDKSYQTKADGTFAIPGGPNQVLTFDHRDFYTKQKQADVNMQVQLSRRFLRNIAGGKHDTARAISILHGEQSATTMLQSVGTAYTEQLTTTPASQFLQALPGRIAGLNIGFTSGGPALDGVGLSYNVRSALGANIILIDGVQRSFLSIDPEEIESVSVLRDALSTAMFGMRSSNGIISIITKKGDSGTPRISFSYQFGVESPLGLPKPLSAGQYALLYNEAQQNDAGTTTITPKYSAADIAAYNNGSDPYGHPNVDWYKTVLKNTSALKRYNFNLQGSGKGFRYFVDLDQMTETGLLKTIDSNSYNTNAQLDRYLLRTNLGVDITRTTQMQLNLFGRMEKNNQPGVGAGTPAQGSNGIFSALTTTPNNAYPVFNPDGSLGGTSLYGQNVNIYGQAVQRGYSFTNLRDMAVDLQVTQRLDDLLPGLYLKGQGSYNNSSNYTTTRAKDFAVFQYFPLTNSYTKIGATSAQTTAGAPGARSRVTYAEADLGYAHSFGKHHVSAVILTDQQSNMQFDTGNLPENYTDYAARVTYDWDQKYLLEASGSHSGYNWFAPQYRWANFGAVGAGWNIHKEAFIADNIKAISNLKLRGSYGRTGQANAGYYTYIQTYWNYSNTFNNDGYYFGTNGVTRSTGQSALAVVVAPEKAKKLNLGLDLGLWNNQFTLSAEYFKNRFYDLVGNPGKQTTLLGIGFPQTNKYTYDYWGSDLTAGWQSHIGNFNYFLNANFSFVQSKAVFLDEIPHTYSYQNLTGLPVGLRSGYIATGVFQSYAEINDPKTAVFASTPKSSLRPGDIRYLDRNGDGVINSDDIGPIGNGKPTIYYGITAGFSYKGFDVNVLFQGTQNHQAYLNGDFWYGFGNGGNNNAYEYNLNRWTPSQPSTTATRLWVGSNVNNTQTSSFWLRNADFIRLKNAEVGYTLPSVLTRKIGVPSLKLFTNGLNLVTWSELFKLRKDIDPESLYTGTSYPYPILRTINFGINAKF